MKAYVEVTGDNDDVPSSFYAFFDSERYLFDCGEGTQRFVHGRNGIVLSKVKTIFLTSLSWESIGGLIGFMLTHVEPHGNSLHLVGPKGLHQLLLASKDFQGIQNLKITETECLSEPTVIQETSSTVTAIPIVKHGQTDPTLITNLSKEMLICYIGSTVDIKGKFHPDKAIKLGVPKGKDFSRLANGESVVTSSGQTVTPQQVMDPAIPGTKFLIIRCPSKDYFQSLFENPAWIPYKKGELKFTVVFHVVTSEILATTEYQQFMRELSTSNSQCRNVIVNSENCEYYPSFAGSDRQVSQLQTLVPNLFNGSREERPVHPLPSGIVENDNVMPCTKITRIHLAPTNITGQLEIMTIDANEDNSLENGLEFLTTEKGKVIKKDLDEKISQIECLSPGMNVDRVEYPHVLFTGTSSAIPSKFRNVTGNYIGLKDNRGLLLDAGEGTFGQLFRYFGPTKIKDIIMGIDLIWVSHMHADHHLGIPRILQKQKVYSMRHSVIRPSTIVVGPPPLLKWLKGLSEICDLEYIPCEYEEPNEHLYESCINRLHIKSMTYVPVEHCAGAYGIVIDWTDGFRLTYSGDTRPCQELAKEGMNSNLLIHEATFEDDKLPDAKAKRHSTTGEALQIGRDMNAQFVYLTHFSSRYPRLPTTTTEQTNFGVAFDLLAISPYQYPFVQWSLKPIDMFFTHELEKKEQEKKEIAQQQIQQQTKQLNKFPNHNNNNNTKSETTQPLSEMELFLQQQQRENERLEKYYKKHRHVKKVFGTIYIDVIEKKFNIVIPPSKIIQCGDMNIDTTTTSTTATISNENTIEH
ncbi:hypothetical protein DLAC_10335 [Tieghemostelium lacteum]|uniref:ribonuclease Z n=1 Tax=Tieghemostelium lacteum TaxID=361077 RepID=A0A151Z554_TIELA|nr:hypothetical protein DLAC_10335 [Tieghemostelium lacteum]|eukprot:KYQ89103.1 hypothetical protein DLAC_10335 [Tieghemostelium lacteum]